MDFRMYDSALGRFHNIDKLAELAPMHNPYRFAFNNPVYWRDPSGLFESKYLAVPGSKGTKVGEIHKDEDGEWEWNGEIWKGKNGTEDFIVGNEVEVVATKKNNSLDAAEYFNNAISGYGTGLSFLSNQGGYFYVNKANWLTPSNVPGEVNIKINYTSKSFRTGNQYTSKPISASKVIAKGTIVTSILLEIPEIADGFKESKKEGIKQTAGAAGGILGGALGGAKLGAILGIETGPGAIVTATIGAVVGAWLGEDAVEAVIDNVNINDFNTDHFRAEPGLNGCFLAGTKILMANGSEKLIEDVKEGEFVMSYNFDLLKLEPKKVLEKISPTHKEIIEIVFTNGLKNSNTFDHPYYVLGKGWASYNPKETFEKYGMIVKQIEINDKCYLFNKGKLNIVEVADFKTNNGKFITFNLSKIEGNHNFFANGILVHNKFNNE